MQHSQNLGAYTRTQTKHRCGRTNKQSNSWPGRLNITNKFTKKRTTSHMPVHKRHSKSWGMSTNKPLQRTLVCLVLLPLWHLANKHSGEVIAISDEKRCAQITVELTERALERTNKKDIHRGMTKHEKHCAGTNGRSK